MGAAVSTRVRGGVAQRIAFKRSRNSLSLASTLDIDIHSPVPPANLYHAVHRKFIQRPLHPPSAAVARTSVSGRNSASWLDRVLGPRRPVLRRAIAGIASDRISVTGTGVRRIGRSTLISIARSNGISGLSRAAWRRIGRGSGVGVSGVAWRSVTRGGVSWLS